jgi:two-component system, chemotaxis family, chemotaxis protein CheY
VTAPVRSVLVVDDDADIREVIAMVLEGEGYAPVTAADGGEALRLLRGYRPCLILLDLMMPGVDGWQFREAQLEDGSLAGIPIVILTGGGNVDAHATALRAAAALEKPVDLEVLLETVDRHCLRA